MAFPSLLATNENQLSNLICWQCKKIVLITSLIQNIHFRPCPKILRTYTVLSIFDIKPQTKSTVNATSFNKTQIRLTANVLCTLRDLDVEQFLYCQRIALLTTQHRYVIQPVKIWQTLSRKKQAVNY